VTKLIQWATKVDDQTFLSTYKKIRNLFIGATKNEQSQIEPLIGRKKAQTSLKESLPSVSTDSDNNNVAASNDNTNTCDNKNKNKNNNDKKIKNKKSIKYDYTCPVKDLHQKHQDITSCFHDLVELFTLYGFKNRGYSGTKTLQYWKRLLGWSQPWIPFMKYKLNAFYSYHKGEPLPLRPNYVPETDNPGILLGGAAYRFVRFLKNSVSGLEFDSFLFSIKMAKKGFPRPSKWSLKAAECAAFLALSVPAPLENSEFIIPWSDIPEVTAKGFDTPYYLTRETATQQLVRTVQEIFKNVPKLSIQDRIEPFFPSTSANYIRSRNGAGAIGAILEHPAFARFRTTHGLVQISKGHLSKKRYVDKLSDDFIENEDNLKTPYVANLTHLKKHFASFYWHLLKVASSEVPNAEFLALAEALKVRVISKGPPFIYTALKPLQRYMWKTLKSLPVFKLIGTPVTPLYVSRQMGNVLPAGYSYLSGDYEAATNNIKSWASDIVVHTVSSCIGLSDVERELFQLALTGHVLNRKDFDPKPQRSGQLMGSIVSFPVLCIINAAVCRWALELGDSRKWSLSDARLAINGDDCLLRTNDRGHTAWRKISSYFGLKPSEGKYYFSDKFLEINSREFHHVEVPSRIPCTKYVNRLTGRVHEKMPELYQDMEDGFDSLPVSFHDSRFLGRAHDMGRFYPRDLFDTVHYERMCNFLAVPFVNMGILKGLKRSSTGSSKKGVETIVSIESLGMCARELLRDCPPCVDEKSLLRRFISHHKKILNEIRVPWFIPEWLGGVGLPWIVDKSFKHELDIDLYKTKYSMSATDLDLRIAMRILLNWKERSPSMLVSKGSWSMHKYAMSRLPPLEHGDDWTSGEISSYGTLYQHLVVEALFSQPLDALYDEAPVQTSKMLLRKNEKLWSVTSKGGLPFPIPLDRLFNEKDASMIQVNCYDVIVT
jgi:hypothetical protein